MSSQIGQNGGGGYAYMYILDNGFIYSRYVLIRMLKNAETEGILEFKTPGRPQCFARITKPYKCTDSSREAVNRRYTKAHKTVVKFQVC